MVANDGLMTQRPERTSSGLSECHLVALPPLPLWMLLKRSAIREFAGFPPAFLGAPAVVCQATIQPRTVWRPGSSVVAKRTPRGAHDCAVT